MNLKNKMINPHTKTYNYLESNLEGGVIFESKRLKKRYGGAGVLLVDMFRNKNGRKEPTVILFESKRKEGTVFEDIGGKIDKEDLHSLYPLATAAAREAFEESRGMLSITNPLHIGSRVKGRDMFVDIPFKDRYYRCYILCLKQGLLQNRDYLENKDSLNRRDVPRTMKETHSIRRFFIKDLPMFEKSDKKGSIKNTNKNYKVKDTSGRERIVYKRTMEVIRAAYKNGLLKFAIKHPKDMVKLSTLITIN